MKVLILGHRGMLGSDLYNLFSLQHQVIGWDKEEVDVTNKAIITSQTLSLKPEIIINATGYTNVDGAEDNRAAAYRLNTEAVGNIASAAADVGAKLVHFSTEYVFSGEADGGYNEDSPTDPISIYGESKRDGESFITSYSQGYLVRTSWLYGKAPQRGKPRGANFIDTILTAAQNGEVVKVVDDQFGKLTATKDLAAAVLRLITGNYQPGIYHLVNEGVASWYQVAEAVWKFKKVSAPLIPISSAEYLMKARRPKHAVLNNNKFPGLRPWTEALAEYLS